MPMPAAVTLPCRRTMRFFLLTTVPASVIAPGPANARASTVPAGFGIPLPAPHGVHSDSQRTAPAGGVKTLFTVNVALFSCAPEGERPGDPIGVSDGDRQTDIFAEPSAASAPAVALMYTGRLIVCPATESCRIQTACALCAHASVACCAGSATSTSPVKGRSMFPWSRAMTTPVVVPIFAPGAALVFSVYPAGT